MESDTHVVGTGADSGEAGCVLLGAAAVGLPALMVALAICSLLVGLQHRNASPLTGGCMGYWLWIPLAGAVVGLGLGLVASRVLARSGAAAVRSAQRLALAWVGLCTLLIVMPTLPTAPAKIRRLLQAQIPFGRLPAPTILRGAPGQSDHQFGSALALDAETLAIVSATSSVSDGSVSIFGRVSAASNAWREVKMLAPPASGCGGRSGDSVAIDGDTLVVGVPTVAGDADAASGRVCVFGRDEGGTGSWGLVQELRVPAGGQRAHLGSAVAVAGQTIVAGATNCDGEDVRQMGEAFVFERELAAGGRWQLTKTLASDAVERSGDKFGCAVAIDGDTIAIGARGTQVAGARNRGRAYVFDRNEGGPSRWGQAQVLTPGREGVGDEFGRDVSLDADRLLVSATQLGGAVCCNRIGPGRAVVFERAPGTGAPWRETATLTAGDGMMDDAFGWSAVLAGDIAAISATAADTSGARSPGKVYVFERNDGTGAWTERHGLVAPQEAECWRGQYGWDVAVRDGVLVVSDPWCTNTAATAILRADRRSNHGRVYAYKVPDQIDK